jgi:hypothetical protein
LGKHYRDDLGSPDPQHTNFLCLMVPDAPFNNVPLR